MTTPNYAPPPPPRKMYVLQGTHNANNASLDFRSHLTLRWADKWVVAAGGLRAPHSGLIRRALALYSKHLESLSPSEAVGELQSIKAACMGTHTPRDEQDAAIARFKAVDVTAGLPLVPFEVVLRGQYLVDETARMLKHLEQFDQPIPVKPIRAKATAAATKKVKALP